MAAIAAQPSPLAKAQKYKTVSNDLKNVRAGFQAAAAATGAFGVQQAKIVSGSEKLNEAIRKQDIGLKDTIRNRKLFNIALKEQIALQNASLAQWTRTGAGRGSVDLLIPRDAPGRVASLSQKMGYYNQLLGSVAKNTINWGKNTQWAGRQIMVGITVPLAALAAVSAVLAYQVDKQLTRIAKVYDTTAQNFADGAHKQMAITKELDQLRRDSTDLATRLARQYGASITDTLQIEAQLAATGVRGIDLLKATAEATRIATLGELEYQEAIDVTVSLQNAFGLSTDQLAEKFNFMNAVENATSLSINDIALATPRAATALAGLGVTVEEMVILLTAMRERGVDAEQGANALKSATTRLLRPTADATKRFGELGINIEGVVKATGGNLFQTLKILAVEMKDVENLTKQQAIAALFGTYQYNRLNATLAGLGETFAGLGDASSQTARAFAVSQQSTEEWASSADTEIRRINDSASGRFKRTLETMKAELAVLGEPVLDVANIIVGAIGKIISAFNGLSGGAKLAILGILGFAAIMGPLIMIIGIFANLFGQIMRMTSAVGSLVFKFRIMSVEERAQALAAKQATTATGQQTIALNNLKIAMDRLIVSQQAMAAGNRAIAASSVMGAAAVGGAAAGSRSGVPPVMPLILPGSRPPATGPVTPLTPRPGHTSPFTPVVRPGAPMTEGARAAEKLQGSTKAIRRDWDKIAARVAVLGLGAAVVGTMATDSNKTAQSLVQALFVASILVTLLPMSRIAAGISGAFGSKGTGLVALLKKSLIGAKALTVALMKLWPILVIGGIIAGIMKITDSLDNAQKAQQEINKSAEAWSQILGFTKIAAPAAGVLPNAEEVIASEQVQLVEALKEANESLYNALQNTTDAQEAMNIAIQEGIKVAQSGGEMRDVAQAIRTALMASGKSLPEAEELVLQITAEIDFESPTSLRKAALEQVNLAVDEALNSAGDKNIWESLFSDVSDDAAAAGQKAGDAFATAVNNEPDLLGREKMFDDFKENFAKNVEDIWPDISNQFAIMDTLDLNSMQEFLSLKEELAKIQSSELGLSDDEIAEKMGISAFELFGLRNAIIGTTGALAEYEKIEEEVAKQIAVSNGLRPDQIEDIKTIADVQRAMGLEFISTAQASSAYTDEIRTASLTQGDLSEAELLAILNKQRLRAGLDNASHSSEGFKKSTDDVTQSLEEEELAAEEAAAAIEDHRQAILDSAREVMEKTTSSVFDEIENIAANEAEEAIEAVRQDGQNKIDALESQGEAMDKEFERRQEALAEQNEREQDQFDSRWDSIMDRHERNWEQRTETETAAYDSRIGKIQETIDAEQDAEDNRQKIFDAELRRIERMANIFGTNIDFNIALESGDLDEAARISNDAVAQQQTWNVEDQARAAEDLAELRTDRLNDSLQKTEEEKTDRLDMLAELEEAEKARLDDQKERDQDLLDYRKEMMDKTLSAEQEAARAGLAVAQERASKELEANVETAEKSWEAKRKALQQELDTLRAFIPRNEAELLAHTQRVQATYDAYGGDLKTSGAEWGQFVGDALAREVRTQAEALDTDIAWKEVADSITEDMASSFDLTGDQLLQWLKTGVFPGSTFGTTGTKSGGTIGASGSRVQSIHEGGSPGFSAKDRTGVPRGAGLYPSEVPAILKRKEFVMSEKATSHYGPGMLGAMNKRQLSIGDMAVRHEGGLAGTTALHQGGSGGPIGAVTGALLGAAMARAISTGVRQAVSQTTGAMSESMQRMYSQLEGGVFGGVPLTDEQLGNATIIMNVGSEMGATDSDLIVALMTSMQESNLRNINYGDRDSVGLFQQRTSQGWGTIEQIMDPYYSSRKFFEGLLAIEGRASMSKTAQAQAVQRSAYPDAYAKWEDMATAVVYASQQMPTFVETGGQGSGTYTPDGRSVWEQMWEIIRSQFPQAKLNSAYRAGDPGYHGRGQAIDIGESGFSGGAGRPYIADMADWIYKNYRNSTELIYTGLYDRSPDLKHGSILDYGSATNAQHTNHAHWAMASAGMLARHGGGAIPQLFDGGTIRYNNTIANLHKNERVLTAPLTDRLDRFLENNEDRSSDIYRVVIDLRGAMVKEDVDIESAVRTAMDNLQNKLGRKKIIKSG